MKKIILITVLVMGLFLRVYRTPDFLGFWYDQGRDAKVVWDLWQNQKFFLIGPTTGIEGIFLGPFYYYLLTPFYVLGNGDPVIPAIGLSIMCMVGVYLMYKIGSEFFSVSTGILAAFIYSLSFQFMSYNRWLSNPTPLVLFSTLLIFLLFKILNPKTKSVVWVISGIVLGLCLQLEAASATFFIPSILVLFFIYRKSSRLSLPKIFNFLLGLGLTLLPQILFDFRHDHILLLGFKNFLINTQSFKPEVTGSFLERIQSYWNYFTNKLFTSTLMAFSGTVVMWLSILLFKLNINKPKLSILLLWWVTPLILLLFYHGNNGYVWDYYFTGVYPAFILTISYMLILLWNYSQKGKLIVAFLLLAFTIQNSIAHRHFFSAALPAYISLSPMIQAVDWVFEDSVGHKFNTDIYVPPIISHSYDYLFLWRGNKIHHRLPEASLQPRLYTIIEPDGEHPQLRGLWVLRQNGFSAIDLEKTFGPLIAQRRLRTK